VIATAVTLALVLGGGGTAGALSVINRAPVAAFRSQSVSYRSSIAVSVAGRAARTFVQTGEIDFASHAYRAVLLTGGSPTVLEWRTVGDVLYETHPGLLANGRPQKPWSAVRLGPSQSTALLSAPESRAITDPLAVLRLLGATADRPVYLGTQATEGVATRGYGIETNLASVLREVANARHVPAAYATTRATFEIWLDPGGRPRRVEEVLAATANGVPVTLTATLDFAGYGAPVAIHAPSGVEPSATIAGTPRQPLVGLPTRYFETRLRAP
jgi:hypothetical protein